MNASTGTTTAEVGEAPSSVPAAALKLVNDPSSAWEITRASQGEPQVLIDIDQHAADNVYAHFEEDGIPDKPPGTVRFVCISDTHSYESKTNMKGPTAFASIPDGDVIMHCGDFTNVGRLEEVEAFASWFGSLPHKRKILIAGNHDLSMEPGTYEETAMRFGGFGKSCKMLDAAAICAKARATIDAIPNCEYLEDTGTSVQGITVWGSPWQPTFCDWAFNLRRGEQCREKWKLIPKGTDIVLTHGPPLGHGDLCQPHHNRAGCLDLLDELQTRVKPKYHCFGHIHEAWGVTTDGVTRYVNASTCNLRYRPVNRPIVLDVEVPKIAEVTEAAKTPASTATS
mmetsp:Transcript_34870/g.69577  ORF Transcript_34870/g.69577 Transcript_34870/m.69577 type:complete len:340 (-) Transcript_34870:242-1261(-)